MKRAILLLIFTAVLIPLTSYAEQYPGIIKNISGELELKETKPNGIYVSPEGTIWVLLSKGYYLRLSTSPEEGAPSVLLKHQGGKKPGEYLPFKWEDHGYHTLLHPLHKNTRKSKLGRKKADIYPVLADGLAPMAEMLFASSPMYQEKEDATVYGEPADIVLRAFDLGSGVFKTYYSLDDQKFVAFQTPIKLDQEKTFKLAYYAIDNVGNESEIRTHTIRFDFTPPESKHTVAGLHVQDILSSRSKIMLSSSDDTGVSGIFYKIGEKTKKYDKNQSIIKELPDGDYQLSYFAADHVKNKEKAKSYSFYLDKTPPVVKHIVGGDYHKTEKGEYLSERSTIELKSSDNKVGIREIRYEVPIQEGYVKEAIHKVYGSPFRLPQRNGQVQFSYLATDKLNNTSKMVKHSMIMDLVPPKISLFKIKGEQHFMQGIHYIRKTTDLIFSITDEFSGVQYFNYQIDQRDPQIHSSKKPINVVSEGPHTLNLKGADYVNNENQKNILVHVDEIPPTVTKIYSISPIKEENKQKLYPTNTTLFLAANDGQSGVKKLFYKLNKEKEQLYQTPLIFKKSGNYTMSIRAVDNVGNTTKDEIQFQIIKSGNKVVNTTKDETQFRVTKS